MKKIFYKSMSLVFGLIMACMSTAGCSCSNQKEVKVEKATNTITPSESILDTKLNTLHSITVTDGDKDLIVNGQTDYKIVIPANEESDKVTTAADELKYFLDLATGSNIEIITDEGITYSSSKKYISVGDTSLISGANLTIDYSTLTRSGFRIISKDESVFLVGGGDFGTLYATYEFLSHEIGYEAYSLGEIYYKKASSIKLHEYDVTDVPDFQYRMASSYWLINNATIRQRMRFNQDSEVWMGPNGYTWHNTFQYIPPEKWKSSHPKWFSDDGTQLCFNAQGDEAEYKLFFEEFMKSFIKTIEENPSIENITITQQDVSTWCKCSVCENEKLTYGTNAATIVKFCNKVSVALEEYFNENNITRNINIGFFAYHKTTTAPVTKDSNGNYVAIDDSVKCRDNVFCFYAPIYADYLRGFNDVANISYTENMDMWCTLTSKMYLWIYATRFQDYFTPYNAIDSMQETYIVAKAHNVEYLYDQCQWNNGVASDWMNLRMYLESKLQWDVKADKTQLTADFMEHFYKDAAEPMSRAFDMYNDWFNYLTDVKGVEGTYTADSAVTAENYPKGFIDGMLNIFDEAYEKIASLEKTDPATYELLYDRICLETLVYRYMNIKYHSTYYTDAELLKLKQDFKTDAVRLGVTKSVEWTAIEDLWENWGV